MTWRTRSAVALLALTLGGCTVTSLHQHNRSSASLSATTTTTASTTPALTKEQAITQVVDAAKQIVEVAQLQKPEGNSSFESCNDQGDPPYKALVVMSFDRPVDIDEATFYQQISATLQDNGWDAGSLPGRHSHGTTLHKDDLTLVMNHNVSGGPLGIINIYGECRIAGPKRLGGAGAPIDFGS